LLKGVHICNLEVCNNCVLGEYVTVYCHWVQNRLCFVFLHAVAENMPPGRKRKPGSSVDGDDPSSNVLVIKRNRLMVKSQVLS